MIKEVSKAEATHPSRKGLTAESPAHLFPVCGRYVDINHTPKIERYFIGTSLYEMENYLANLRFGNL